MISACSSAVSAGPSMGTRTQLQQRSITCIPLAQCTPLAHPSRRILPWLPPSMASFIAALTSFRWCFAPAHVSGYVLLPYACISNLVKAATITRSCKHQLIRSSQAHSNDVLQDPVRMRAHLGEVA